MAASLDNVFGIHAQALRLRAQRTELLASNMANADTPGYKARDIDFKGAMKAAASHTTHQGGLKTTHAGHMSGLGGATGIDSLIKYRVPQQPSLDGNTVETEVEQAAFAKSAVEYQATLRFVEGRSQTIIGALKGE